jgi:CubicO group peptidase (beta-lactamase class C family)
MGIPAPIQRIDERLSQLAAQGFCGAALAAYQGEILLHQGYGWADRERGISMSPETGICIGSLVKLFTQAAVLKLDSAGRLLLPASISEYLPHLPEPMRQITVEHLVRHTSGLPDFIDAQGKPVEYSLDYDYLPVERDELLHKAYLVQLQSPSGERKAYSNLGYSLLGILIEIASGEPYEQYVNAHLFQPAGMTKTGYLLPGWEVECLAVGYLDGRAWGTPREHGWLVDGPSWNVRANGGMTSTVGDLYRWMVRIESGTSLTAVERRKHDELLVRTLSDGQRVMGPAGGNGIFSAVFVWYPDERRFLALASSDSRFYIENFTRELLGHLEELE